MVGLRTHAVLALQGSVLAPGAGVAGDLRIAAWNLENLDDSDGEGCCCVGRFGAGYAGPKRRIAELAANIIAFHEVENMERVSLGSEVRNEGVISVLGVAGQFAPLG